MAKNFGSEWRACLELSRQYNTNVLGMKISRELLVVVFGEKNVRQVFYDKEFDARPHNFFSRLRCLGKKNMGKISNTLLINYNKIVILSSFDHLSK